MTDQQKEPGGASNQPASGKTKAFLKEYRYAILGCGALILILCIPCLPMMAYWISEYFNSELPRDGKIEKVFRDHRQDLETLMAMAKQDHFMATIGWDATNPRIEDAGTSFSLQRWNEYRRLFRKLGIKDGISPEGNAHIVFGSRGLLNDGIEKGIVCFAINPKIVRADLDHLPPDMPAGTTFYKHLEGEWYIYVMNYH